MIPRGYCCECQIKWWSCWPLRKAWFPYLHQKVQTNALLPNLPTPHPTSPSSVLEICRPYWLQYSRHRGKHSAWRRVLRFHRVGRKSNGAFLQLEKSAFENSTSANPYRWEYKQLFGETEFSWKEELEIVVGDRLWELSVEELKRQKRICLEVKWHQHDQKAIQRTATTRKHPWWEKKTSGQPLGTSDA